MNLFNSGYILSNKRFGWIDYDRGISIILVTYRHCYEGMENSGMKMHDYPILEYLNYFLFGFRMPLFFIASGIFVGGSEQSHCCCESDMIQSCQQNVEKQTWSFSTCINNGIDG